jgi:hypothetical protein
MNANRMTTVIRFCAVVVLLGLASLATAVPKPPMGTAHGMEATVTNNVGDSILGDGGVYIDGVDVARIWDYNSPAHDRLTFGAGSTRLKLVIDEGGVNADCLSGTLFVNEPSIPGFQFYNDPTFPVGSSTTAADEDNYGGTFECTTGGRGKNRTGWFVHWKPTDQCIVISRTAADTYTFTAGAGCLADVSPIVKGSAQSPLGAYDVAFQLVATELP